MSKPEYDIHKAEKLIQKMFVWIGEMPPLTPEESKEIITQLLYSLRSATNQIKVLSVMLDQAARSRMPGGNSGAIN